LLNKKERAQANNEKMCEDAKKAIENAREQRRDFQRLRVQFSIAIYVEK
jgi:hypothetical protein